ncbi:MAG: hypothetical protein ACYS76_00055 [Planctomycetota bacterium]
MQSGGSQPGLDDRLLALAKIAPIVVFWLDIRATGCRCRQLGGEHKNGEVMDYGGVTNKPNILADS